MASYGENSHQKLTYRFPKTRPPLEAGKDKETHSLPEPPRETSPVDT